MKVAIMQPYFLPYIGYFQLINHVDKFIIYDNVQYTKKGWINRNRFLNNNQAQYFTLPIKKDSDYLNIKDRVLANDYLLQNKKQLRKIENAYKKAPFFKEVYPIIEKCFLYEKTNLFDFIIHSILAIKEYLNIGTDIIISSEIEDKTDFTGAERVKNICKLINANEYINPIGGTDLYDKVNFKNNGLKLNFLKTKDFEYSQFNNDFVSYLSILDIMMFNSKEEINHMLDYYELI